MGGDLDLLTVAAAAQLPRGVRVAPVLVAQAARPSRVDVLVARATTSRGRDPVDLAVVAVACAETWARGQEVAPPPAPFPAHITRACRLVYRRHHLLVDGEVFARASKALTWILSAAKRQPAPARHAVLCAVLLDLLNDRPEEAFAGVSDVLTRVDRACSRGDVDVEGTAGEIAAAAREEFAR